MRISKGAPSREPPNPQIQRVPPQGVPPQGPPPRVKQPNPPHVQ